MQKLYPRLLLALSMSLAPTMLSAQNQETQSVGAVTTLIDGIKLEAWYPAAKGSEQTAEKRVYDIREFLPDAEANKVPDASRPYQVCDCYGDLPLAPDYDRLPLVIMVHGTAAFRSASLAQATYLASRGYLVIAADHPYIQLKDMVGSLFSLFRANQKRDVETILSALQAQSPDLHPILRRADLGRIGLIGHSAGGGAVSELAGVKGVRALVTMAGGRPVNAEGVFTLVMGAADDGVSRYSSQKQSYAQSAQPKAFLGLSQAGHLAFTDICELMPESGGILAAAKTYGLKVPSLIERLGRDGCGADQLASAKAHAILNLSIGAVMDAQLKGLPLSESWQTLPALFPEVQDLSLELR